MSNPITDLKPTTNTNFCRVFELPDDYPEVFCFNGGSLVTMLMVDWFNPWPPPAGDHFGLADKTWPEVCELLLTFLRQKRYVKPDKKYLVITDFGGSFIFTK